MKSGSGIASKCLGTSLGIPTILGGLCNRRAVYGTGPWHCNYLRRGGIRLACSAVSWFIDARTSVLASATDVTDLYSTNCGPQWRR